MNTLENSRILIIDDNPSIHEDFRKVLDAHDENSKMDDLKGKIFDQITFKVPQIQYEIDSAYQGEEGLDLVKKALAEKRPYAMAFVDILMPPGWDGVETIKKIWMSDPEIQVAICTAYADYSWEDVIRELGISDQLLILKKPSDSIEIRQIACCLVKKWNLNQQVGHQFDKLQKLINDQTKETQKVILEFVNMQNLIHKKTNETQDADA